MTPYTDGKNKYCVPCWEEKIRREQWGGEETCSGKDYRDKRRKRRVA